MALSGTLSDLAGLSAGGELAGEVDRWRPRVVARARCCWLVLGEYPVGHCPEDQGADEVLAEVIDVTDGVEDPGVRAFPDQGVGDDDGGCVGSGPPVGGEVDDRGRQPVVEQHVAAEVAVDELAGGWHGTEHGGQPWQVVNLREVVGGDLAPGDAVAGGPGLAR